MKKIEKQLLYLVIEEYMYFFNRKYIGLVCNTHCFYRLSIYSLLYSRDTRERFVRHKSSY